MEHGASNAASAAQDKRLDVLLPTLQEAAGLGHSARGDGMTYVAPVDAERQVPLLEHAVTAWAPGMVRP